MVMILVCYFLQFRYIEQPGEIVEVEHRIVFAVIAEERHIVTKIHILQMIGNKTAVTPLYPLAKFL